MALTTSLVSHWNFSETTGQRFDKVGTNHLSEFGPPTSVAGKIGNGIDCEESGSAQYLSLASNSDVNLGDVDFAFGVWVKLESKTNNNEIITKWGNAGVKQYRLQYFAGGDRFRWLVSNDGTANTNVLANTLGSPSTATWYYIVCWHDATANVIGISVNAGTADTAAHTTGVQTTSTLFQIGARENLTADEEMDGIIDEVSLWHAVPSSADRTALYASGSGLEFVPDTFCGIGGLKDTSFVYRAGLQIGGTVKIEYSTSSDLTSSTTSTGVTVVGGDDYTGGETITGLTANTKYYYSPVVNGQRSYDAPYQSFTTLPTADTDSALTVCFSSCQDDGNYATIAASIDADVPNLFLHLGDFGYPDTTTLATQRDNYQTQLVNYPYTTSIKNKYAVERVWDDHDYAGNNTSGDEAGKANSLQAFKEYTAHHVLDNATKGIWRNFTCANVEFYMLDTRYQREGTQVRFPTSATNTADTGSSGTSLVLRVTDTPSAVDDFYNGYYVFVESVYRRITDYVALTRACTLDASVTGLDSSSTYALKQASMLDQDNLGASGQIDWLITGINASTNRWKVIVSPTAFNATVSFPSAVDSWGDWDSEEFERNYITQEITADNVIVISGDRHYAGIDNGTNSTWPEACISPINKTDRAVEGTWTQGSDATGKKYGSLIFATSPHQVTITCHDENGTTTASITPLVVSDAAPAGGGFLTTNYWQDNY